MDLTSFEALLSPRGQEVLRAAEQLLAGPSTFLMSATKLRKKYDAALVQAALETISLRRKAAHKFTQAGKMYFEAEALEVASGEQVSAYRASRFAGYDHIADLGCGLGGDSLSLATFGHRVLAWDRDSLRSALTRANAAAVELAERIVVQQVDILDTSRPTVEAAFADPARRHNGQRFLGLDQYQPSPQAIAARFPLGFPLAFKLAPGLDRAELTTLPGEVEFISLHGELKECVVWQGPLQTTLRRATLLPGPWQMQSDRVLPPCEVRSPGGVLYDPDPAVVRAGLAPLLAEQLGAGALDHRVQLLTADQHRPTPFAAAYVVEDIWKWDCKIVNAGLRRAQVGRLTPIHRGAPPDAESFRRSWKCPGTEHRHAILTRSAGTACVILARRLG